EPARRRALAALDEDEIAGVLSPGGKLSRRIPGYELRASQVSLARHVVRAFNEGFVLAAEAGTGVGKSYAYLLPSFAWAAKNRDRVVVSTATLNLQHQLMDKDIPAVRDLFRKKLKAVLAKGRGNYTCRNRLAEALDEEGLLAGEDHPLRRIASWARQSPTGDRADLSFWPDEETWSRVRSEADACPGLRCPWRGDCFVLRARREAADADLIVTNHHLLFADLAARMNGAGYEAAAVLPPFQALVFDEAHALESSALSCFSDELTRFAVLRALGRLLRSKGERSFGILARVQNIEGLPADLFSQVPARIASVQAAAGDLDARTLAFLAADPAVWVRHREPAWEESLFAPLSALELSLVALAQLLKDLFDSLPEEVSTDPSVNEARLILRRLSGQAGLCSKFREPQEYPEAVLWVSRDRTSRGEAFPRFISTPLDLSGMMDEAVFHPYRSIVCTSATLAVGESFDYWKRRVGLFRTDAEVETAVYPSPFPYEQNALVALPDDAPPPNDGRWQAWVDSAVIRLLEASSGHALVLFTSYESLRSAYEAALPRLTLLGITAFRQGQDERGRLLEAFKADAASVLFATDSFWEGVDAP
ncbi:MAG TPA: ATP-dependent DNA helicase, partial [Magnetospirillaceae bacterium]|nr:ATP-dependent DNA helicase [Magnetospirillaceae bacterium]